MLAIESPKDPNRAYWTVKWEKRNLVMFPNPYREFWKNNIPVIGIKKCAGHIRQADRDKVEELLPRLKECLKKVFGLEEVSFPRELAETIYEGFRFQDGPVGTVKSYDYHRISNKLNTDEIRQNFEFCINKVSDQ